MQENARRTTNVVMVLKVSMSVHELPSVLHAHGWFVNAVVGFVGVATLEARVA